MPSGELYVGYFENDDRNGLGTSYQNDNTTTRTEILSVSGEWKDDRPHGLCKTVNTNGSISIAYQSNGKLEMDKMLYLSNSAGDFFTGIKVEGGMKGYARKFDRKGAVFDGFLRNNKKDGHGKTIKPDGTELSSMWHYGKKHGSGVLKKPGQTKKFRIFTRSE